MRSCVERSSGKIWKPQVPEIKSKIQMPKVPEVFVYILVLRVMVWCPVITCVERSSGKVRIPKVAEMKGKIRIPKVAKMKGKIRMSKEPEMKSASREDAPFVHISVWRILVWCPVMLCVGKFLGNVWISKVPEMQSVSRHLFTVSLYIRSTLKVKCCKILCRMWLGLGRTNKVVENVPFKVTSLQTSQSQLAWTRLSRM